MRNRFFSDIAAVMERDPDVILITGDLGFGVIEPLMQSVPDQVINAGVAEQNMTGLAAGIALSGAQVFTYSIANFPTLRCLEQIRNDVAYHEANVVVVAVGGGLVYGALGMSHHATEDIAIMRSIPGMAIAAPGDPVEVGVVLNDLVTHGGPAYLRLGKAGEPTVHDPNVTFGRGQFVPIRDGVDVVLLSTGGMLPSTIATADLLAARDIQASVVSVPWIAPFDTAALARLASTHSLIVTIEEHSIAGGLGGSAAEVLAELASGARLLRLGLPHAFSSVVGSQEYLRTLNALDASSMCERISQRLASLR